MKNKKIYMQSWDYSRSEVSFSQSHPNCEFTRFVLRHILSAEHQMLTRLAFKTSHCFCLGGFRAVKQTLHKALLCGKVPSVNLGRSKVTCLDLVFL